MQSLAERELVYKMGLLKVGEEQEYEINFYALPESAGGVGKRKFMILRIE